MKKKKKEIKLTKTDTIELIATKLREDYQARQKKYDAFEKRAENLTQALAQKHIAQGMKSGCKIDHAYIDSGNKLEITVTVKDKNGLKYIHQLHKDAQKVWNGCTLPAHLGRHERFLQREALKKARQMVAVGCNDINKKLEKIYKLPAVQAELKKLLPRTALLKV